LRYVDQSLHIDKGDICTSNPCVICQSITITTLMNILAPGNHDSGKMETGLPVDGNQLISA